MIYFACKGNHLPDYGFKIYPNPANDFLYMQSKTSGTLQFHDLSGRILKEDNFNKGMNTFNVSEFASGIYFVTGISNEQEVHSFKLLKK